MIYNKTSTQINIMEPGGYHSIKMPSYKYRNSNHKDKMVSQLSYLCNRSPHIWKDHIYIDAGPWALIQYKDDILPVLEIPLRR